MALIVEMGRASSDGLHRYGAGLIGGEAVWEHIEALTGYLELGGAGADTDSCAPDADSLVLRDGEVLLSRVDLIVLLGVAELRKLMQVPGVILQ